VSLPVFSPTEDKEIRNRYESGENSVKLERELGHDRHTVLSAIRRAGGTIFLKRKYFINSAKERHLWAHYHLRYYDAVWLHEFQRNKCLWCSAPLPDDPLACLVDHIGGQKGEKNRNNVRGLCCPDGICNTLAGHVEKNRIRKEDWGALSAVVAHIEQTLQSNHGWLSFSRHEDGSWAK
jgi:Recombination endonuclease VII